jgi:hypothetical protein
MLELGKLYTFLDSKSDRFENLCAYKDIKDAKNVIKQYSINPYRDKIVHDFVLKGQPCMLTAMERVGKKGENYILEFMRLDLILEKKDRAFYVPLNLSFKEYIKYLPIKMVKGESCNDSGTESE